MATLHHFPIFHSLSSPRLSISFRFHPSYSTLNHHQVFRYSAITASSVKKSPRAIRKPKSDEELCNDINDFLSGAGLPENHVPTTKELSQYGRQDLANIVRRRGYRYIRELLETSSTANFISDTRTSQTGNLEILDESQEEDTDSCLEEDEELQMYSQGSIVAESLFLQEKVARFIQFGESDETEDGASRITNNQEAEEEGKTTELEHANEPEFALSSSNGNIPSPEFKVEYSASESTTSRSGYISTEEQTNNSAGDLDNDKQELENQAAIDYLRVLLHKKELELAQLKEEIEKEKLALSLLHSKAEEEISKAQELVSEKETELQEAEELLSELVEVDIQYSGEGETVELAGSFNGWHHKIPMDLQSTSSTTEPTETEFRTSPIWQVFLWLYPGVYEIKFVVDGHWIVDPERESITHNGVHNNILRVDK